MPCHPLRLELSSVQKKELLLFMKNTLYKEEYRRAYAVKQKMKGGTIQDHSQGHWCQLP